MLLLLPTLQLARAALRHWFTWNCSPQYARITSSIARLFVTFAGTKHCCLTAINRCGALCCPDFPRDRGLKQVFFFHYPAIDRYTMSGIRESNPPPRLGKPMHYRCANAANSVQRYSFFFIYTKKTKKYLFFLLLSSVYCWLIFGSVRALVRNRAKGVINGLQTHIFSI